MSVGLVNLGLPPGRALFMVKCRTIGNFHVAAIIGDVVPSFIANC
jgi:hypothetical protein